MKNILIIAAENSAENYGVQVVEEFKKNRSPVDFFGVGGERMIRKGVEVLIHNKDLALAGIIEVISSLPRVRRYMNILFKAAVERKADAALLIDFPEFNLRMAKKFKEAGIRVYYYISPTVWAWRYSRVKRIKKYVDHIFIIFPFEVPIYREEGIPFTYTGHPLVPVIKASQPREEFRRQHAVPPDELMLTLLPGSRKTEIKALLPTMMAAVEVLEKEFKIAVFLLKADGIGSELLQPPLAASPLRVQIVDQEQGYNLINASDIVLTTCGTSNLEIAVLGVPFTSVYRVNQLSYLLGKRLVKINLYSIVNILAGREVVRELIQYDFTVDNIVADMRRILTGPGAREKMLAEFARVREMLTQDHHPPEIIYNKIVKDLSEGQKPF